MTTPLDEGSPAWCLRLVSELDAANARAISLAKTLTPQQLNWKPGPSEWSVGNCLEHLCIANEIYVGAMSDAFAGHPLAAVQNISPGWFGRWFIRNYIAPSSVTRRARAPKKIRPGALVEPSVLDRFLSSNEQVRELVHRASRYDVNRIRFRNPFIPVIRFTVGTGLEILAKHEDRHLLQAERIRASSGFPEQEPRS